MLSFIREFSGTRLCWLILLVLGLGLEIYGLYLQYYLRWDPCVNCVYERAWFGGFVAAGVIGFLGAGLRPVQGLAAAVLALASCGGLRVSIDHYLVTSSATFGANCKLVANFPGFLPLDQWLPWLFNPTGQCAPLPWSLWGLNLPEWLIVTFGCGALAGTVVLAALLYRPRRRDYSRLYR